MANRIYNNAKELFLQGNLSWTGSNIKVALLKSTYTYSDNHLYLNTVSSYVNGTSVNLSGKSCSSGILDAEDTTLIASYAEASSGILVYKDTGDPATSPLILFMNEGTGFPFTPAVGQLIHINFSNDTNKIFKWN